MFCLVTRLMDSQKTPAELSFSDTGNKRLQEAARVFQKAACLKKTAVLWKGPDPADPVNSNPSRGQATPFHQARLPL